MPTNTQRLSYDFSHSLLSDLFFRPWVFWFKVLSFNTAPALIGLAVILIVLIMLGKLTAHPYIYSGMFLFWIGPVLFYMPLLLAFIIPNMLKGDFTMTIGCVKRDDGSYECL